MLTDEGLASKSVARWRAVEAAQLIPDRFIHSCGISLCWQGPTVLTILRA